MSIVSDYLTLDRGSRVLAACAALCVDVSTVLYRLTLGAIWLSRVIIVSVDSSETTLVLLKSTKKILKFKQNSRM